MRLLGTYLVEQMAKFASHKDFSHLAILSEKNKECNG